MQETIYQEDDYLVYCYDDDDDDDNDDDNNKGTLFRHYSFALYSFH